MMCNKKLIFLSLRTKGKAIPRFSSLRENKKQSGQLMVEAIIAMSIITLSILGIFNLISRSVGQTRLVSDQIIAINLAAEGLETAKNILDGNVYHSPPRPWDEGFSDGVYLIQYNDTLIAGRRLSGDFLDCNTIARQPENFLYFNPATGIYSYDRSLGSQPTPFKRVLCIDNVNQHRIQAVSKVVWATRQISREITLSAEFLGWRR